jgi:hypothetical protein
MNPRVVMTVDGWVTDGDYNITVINHLLNMGWLNYPRYPIDRSEGFDQ